MNSKVYRCKTRICFPINTTKFTWIVGQSFIDSERYYFLSNLPRKQRSVFYQHNFFMPYINLILNYLREPSLINFKRAKEVFFGFGFGFFFFCLFVCFTFLTILPSPNQILNEIFLTPNWLWDFPEAPWKVSNDLFSHLVKREMYFLAYLIG